MTCKDCIHYEVCKLTPPEYATAKYYTFCNCAEKCECFKDKSKYIELPCIKFKLKYQDCDRYGHYWGNSNWNEVTVFANTLSEAIAKAVKISNTKYYRGLTYTAEEQAEQKLKELQNA